MTHKNNRKNMTKKYNIINIIAIHPITQKCHQNSLFLLQNIPSNNENQLCVFLVLWSQREAEADWKRK